ncbi:uncharacterized protein BDZ83DRAFT_726473 [Colletotrichum acutatum]|uniref:Uncharacterized protein n=1 Tax=Glomerella acutata TaxID=27357 RepID=A0AAD8XNQ1_GLOAC|nr:uncharacterized protein BDZ83DRAFT_726473 [Colletotrichum acutatum]KAK1730662.1 hypothetical protein BDZ83DRAFT_726473 [Colletotrichum acutatum]
MEHFRKLWKLFLPGLLASVERRGSLINQMDEVSFEFSKNAEGEWCCQSFSALEKFIQVVEDAGIAPLLIPPKPSRLVWHSSTLRVETAVPRNLRLGVVSVNSSRGDTYFLYSVFFSRRTLEEAGKVVRKGILKRKRWQSSPKKLVNFRDATRTPESVIP